MPDLGCPPPPAPCEKRSPEGGRLILLSKINGHARRRLDAQDRQMRLRCEQS